MKLAAMPRLLGYIPARLGSERVRRKNLRPLNGKPLLAHAIETARATTALDHFVLNTESEEIASVAHPYGFPVYRRPAELAGSATRTDEIVVDFIRANPCDAVLVMNPTAPFLRPGTVDAMARRFLEERPTSLFSVTALRRHAFMDGQALNFDAAGPSPRTQDLRPIQMINFVICIFDARHAVEAYERHGSFLYRGRLSFVPMAPEEEFDIDEEHEFAMAELMLRMRQEGRR